LNRLIEIAIKKSEIAISASRAGLFGSSFF